MQVLTFGLYRLVSGVHGARALATYQFALGTLSRDGTAPEEGLRLVVEVERANAEITHEVPPLLGFDFSLVEEARRELGLAGAAR